MLLFALLACAEAPAACTRMCAAAAVATEDCLAEDGLGWEAAGYADEGAFLDACDTWAWEQVQLNREAGGTRTELAAACEDRRVTIEAGDCEEFMALDWNGDIVGATP